MNRDIAERRRESRTTPAAPVRDRIVLLREMGIPTRRLAEELGYHYNTLYIIVAEKSLRTSRLLAEDVFSYPLPSRKKVA